MSLLSRLFKLGGRKGNFGIQEPLHRQLDDMKAFVSALKEASGTDIPINSGTDEIEGGEGDFGRDPRNPIPVNGPTGEVCYLSMLKLRDRCGFLFHRVGSMDGEDGLPIDKYEILSVDGSVNEFLYFNMYYARRSNLAPDGFQLDPTNWDEDMTVDMDKIGWRGVNAFVDNFPIGLPEAVREVWDAARPGMGGLQQGFCQAIVNQATGNNCMTFISP